MCKYGIYCYDEDGNKEMLMGIFTDPYDATVFLEEHYSNDEDKDLYFVDEYDEYLDGDDF